eukprot:821751-Pelagomonas_calceolata.AAC.1
MVPLEPACASRTSKKLCRGGAAMSSCLQLCHHHDDYHVGPFVSSILWLGCTGWAEIASIKPRSVTGYPHQGYGSCSILFCELNATMWPEE